MNYSIKTAVSPGGRWVAFRDGADLSAYDESLMVTWRLEGDAPTVSSLIRANDSLVDFGLKRDKGGLYNETAYNMAYQVAFAQEHLRKIGGPDGEIEGPTPEQVAALPPAVLAAYVLRADTSRGVAASDLDFLRRPPHGEGG